jgi:DNA-binding MarR family transcriptional regulator
MPRRPIRVDIELFRRLVQGLPDVRPVETIARDSGERADRARSEAHLQRGGEHGAAGDGHVEGRDDTSGGAPEGRDATSDSATENGDYRAEGAGEAEDGDYTTEGDGEAEGGDHRAEADGEAEDEVLLGEDDNALSASTRSCHDRRGTLSIKRTWPTASPEKLIGEILRTGARLTVSRNALLAGFGMTSARLRLLKMIHQLPVAMPVAGLARAMGVSRQAVQQTVRDLESAGVVELTGNLRNQRAPLVVLSPVGGMQLESLLRVEQRWIADLARGFDALTCAQTCWLLRLVRERTGG